MTDMINHPPHYTQGKYETIDIIEDANWGYRLATAFKYIHRCEYKGKKKEDLRKAVWFLLREIDSITDEVIGHTNCTRCNRPIVTVRSGDWVCLDCVEKEIDKLNEPTKTAIGDEDTYDNPFGLTRNPRTVAAFEANHSQIDSKATQTAPNELVGVAKVIPHNDPKDPLGGHTEAVKYVAPESRYPEHTKAQNAEMDRREEYRANYRKSFGTHKPNVDQLVIQGLAAYD